MADMVLREFMNGLKEIGGNDMFNRAVCYINSFLPEPVKNTQVVYDVMYGVATLDDVLASYTVCK